MTICDGKERFQFIGGPHYPKHYDADLLIYYASQLDDSFEGAKAVADFAFRKAEHFLKKVSLITPTTEAGRPKKDPITGKKRKRELMEEEKLDNKNIREVRSTVEHPPCDQKTNRAHKSNLMNFVHFLINSQSFSIGFLYLLYILT